MNDKTISEFAASEAAKTEDAIKDLERIEEEVIAEAEASVDDYDAMAHKGAAAAAAETAFDFDQAEINTEMLAGELAAPARALSERARRGASRCHGRRLCVCARGRFWGRLAAALHAGPRPGRDESHRGGQKVAIALSGGQKAPMSPFWSSRFRLVRMRELHFPGQGHAILRGGRKSAFEAW